MKNLLKCRQNKWSEIGKDFFTKMRKNTQEFSNIGFCNILTMNKIQNQEKNKGTDLDKDDRNEDPSSMICDKGYFRLSVKDFLDSFRAFFVRIG